MSAVLERNDTAGTEKKGKKRPGSGVLILLMIFVILFLLTTALIGSRLYDLTTRDQYTVDLGVGEPESEIELFRIEYSNETGEITVEGVDGQNVVAPGTTAEYSVRLRNNDEMVIDFMMIPTVEFLSAHDIPVVFKMMDDYGNYILGSDTEWVSAEQMDTFAHKGSIHPGEVFTYHISWRWVFEVSDEQDAYDTFLGSMDEKIRPGVSVGITMEAEANPYASTKDITHVTHLRGESFGCCWCCWLVWLLLLAAVVLVGWIWRLRKKLNKLEEALQEYKDTLEMNEPETVL